MSLNYKELPRLLELFHRHDGYWFIDRSEGDNLHIEWNPFIGDKHGGFIPKISRKRVYDIKDFYNEAVNDINKFLDTKEDLWT